MTRPSGGHGIRRWALGALACAGLVACGGEAATPGVDAGARDVTDAPAVVDRATPADVSDVRVWPIPENAPRVTLETYPRVDGSTSTHPLAMVIACELLGLGYTWESGQGSEGEAMIVPIAPTAQAIALRDAVRERIVHSRTHQAYLNLVDGTRDLILVANPPSPDEAAYARDRGVTLDVRPLALDALVVVANVANPVAQLSTAQIRGIFAGSVTNWREVGGADQAIHPYVRPENSGSQQLMESIVMAGTAMADWPEDRRPIFMGALIDRIREDPLAIGYSVYYWVTYQYAITGYRVLAVDGVAPTASTLGARRYPFTAPVLAVTRSDLAPTSLAARLRDWLLTPEGQRTVARSGYVPNAP